MDVSGTRFLEDLERSAEMKTKTTERTERFVSSPIDSERTSLDGGRIFEIRLSILKSTFLRALFLGRTKQSFLWWWSGLRRRRMKLRLARMHGLLELKLGQLIESAESKPLPEEQLYSSKGSSAKDRLRSTSETSSSLLP